MVASGTLEEMDGTPIRAGGPAGPPPSWLRGAVGASRMAAERPGLWVLALTAFLARGGILLLAAPIVALPSFVALATFVGPTSVTPAGPTPRFVILAAGAVALALAAIVAGTVIAAAAETALHRATTEPGQGDGDEVMVALRPGPPRGRGGGRGIVRVVAIRLTLLLPVAAATAASVPAYVAAGYRELSLPSDLGVPLWARIVAGAPVATGAIVVTWLACEVVGGLASRRVVLAGDGALRALAAAVVDLARTPATSLATLVVSLAGSIVALGLALMATAVIGAWAETTVLGGPAWPELMLVALALAVTWLALLAVAAAAAAWRATLWTAQLARRMAVTG